MISSREVWQRLVVVIIGDKLPTFIQSRQKFHGMYVLMALGGCGHRTPLQDERAPYMWADHLEASYCGKAHAGMTADDGHISMRLGDTNSRCQLTDWFTRVHIGTAVPPSFRPSSSQRLQWNNSNGMTFHHCLVHQMNQFIR